MQADFREKTSSVFPGILTHPTGQVSACTIPWTLGTSVLCCTAGFALTRYPSSGVNPLPVVPEGKPGEGFYWYQAANISNLNRKIKKVYFGALPHFPNSSSLSWNALPLLSKAHRALRPPPLFWPKKFHLLLDSLS